MPAAPMVAVLPENHSLAAKRRLRPRDFEGENFISLGPSALSRFRVDRVFAEYGVTRILRIETPLSEIACALAGAGAGVALCEPFTATEYATRGIVARPFEPQIDFEFAALFAAHRSVPPVAREFIDGFKAHVSQFLRRSARR
jgi:DNA-binding transcriptional LysR family regulator